MKVALAVAALALVVWAVVRMIQLWTYRRPEPPRIIAPDDDAEFLRGLDRDDDKRQRDEEA